MNNEDLLYRYFSNSLNAEQESLFNSLLETDAEFKALFEYEKDLKQAIFSNESDKLKAKLQGFEKELAIPKKSLFNYQNFAIAASVLILLGWFGYNSFFSSNYTSLYQDNFSEYPNTVYTITRGDTINSIEREAFVAYESKAYQTAIAKFDVIETEKDYVNFYKAQAYLGLDDSQNAKTFFEKVISENSSFVEEATWYMALIYLKEEDKIQAIKYLENIAKNFNYNKGKAQKLLDQLN